MHDQDDSNFGESNESSDSDDCLICLNDDVSSAATGWDSLLQWNNATLSRPRALYEGTSNTSNWRKSKAQAQAIKRAISLSTWI
jgi:hypothetical protein